MSGKLKIEVGLPYMTRKGDQVTLQIPDKRTFSFFESSWPYIGSNGHYYDLTGRTHKFGFTDDLDIVAPWDAAVSNAALPDQSPTT